jgi:hypothetical protein
MKFVIARYHETLWWTKFLPQTDLIIYNKGRTPIPGSIPLPNVGREGHTYFTYIYDNYDKLDNYTVFLQGDPFDHSPFIFRQLLFYLMKEKVMSFDFHFLSQSVLPCNINQCRYHKNLPMRAVYEHLFEKTPVKTLQFEFGSGAQFIVSREQIRRRPREFYLKIVKMLETSTNPVEGFVVERFHGLIFAPRTRTTENNDSLLF